MKDKKQLLRQLHACLTKNRLSDKEAKAEFVYSATDGRCTSSKDMTELELVQAIHRLNGNTQQVKTGTNDKDFKKRRKVISLFREMDCNTYSETKQSMVADMDTINAKLKNKWGKDINGFNSKELAKVIAVLEKEWLPAHYNKA
jgi:hypothetical protein